MRQVKQQQQRVYSNDDVSDLMRLATEAASGYVQEAFRGLKSRQAELKEASRSGNAEELKDAAENVSLAFHVYQAALDKKGNIKAKCFLLSSDKKHFRRLNRQANRMKDFDEESGMVTAN